MFALKCVNLLNLFAIWGGFCLRTLGVLCFECLIKAVCARCVAYLVKADSRVIE